MVLTFICSLVFLAGGLTSSLELQDDLDNQWTSNQSYKEWQDGNTTSHQPLDFNNETSNLRSDKTRNKCSYWDVLQHLKLTKNKDMFTMSRPVKDYTSKTTVYIVATIYALLDVREEDQSFISYLWIDMEWHNEYISWDKKDFCGISEVKVPREALWMPDVTIKEMTEKDKAVPSPFLTISFDGWVEYMDDKFVISTCKMFIFKFPFDIQRCSLTFKSVLFSDDELSIHPGTSDKHIKNMSIHTMQMQYEWKFIDINATQKIDDYFYSKRSVVVYTVTMKRKSALYVVNFLLPVLFFLFLDFATLLMSNSGSDKISFKITVLLAVTVMQLLLNEVLPFTSSRIPLIVIYCIGIFALMLISLMETIFVRYLMEKDSSSQEDKEEIAKLKTKKASLIASSYDVMTDHTSSIYKEGCSSQLTELFLAVEKVSYELGEIKKTFLYKESEEKKTGYWTRVASKIDKIFSIVYVLIVFLFLTVLFSMWLLK